MLCTDFNKTLLTKKRKAIVLICSVLACSRHTRRRQKSFTCFHFRAFKTGSASIHASMDCFPGSIFWVMKLFKCLITASFSSMDQLFLMTANITHTIQHVVLGGKMVCFKISRVASDIMSGSYSDGRQANRWKEMIPKTTPKGCFVKRRKFGASMNHISV